MVANCSPKRIEKNLECQLCSNLVVQKHLLLITAAALYQSINQSINQYFLSVN